MRKKAVEAMENDSFVSVDTESDDEDNDTEVANQVKRMHADDIKLIVAQVQKEIQAALDETFDKAVSALRGARDREHPSAYGYGSGLDDSRRTNTTAGSTYITSSFPSIIFL